MLLLISLALGISYIKFFKEPNQNLEEHPTENSSNQAINKALQQIVTNFNQNKKIEEYANQSINIKAVLNNHSIYISYVDTTSITYEFNYQNLELNIVVENNEENLNKFKTIYEILILAVQERLENTENIDSYVASFLDDTREYDGLFKEVNAGTITYHMNITKKLQEIDLNGLSTDDNNQTSMIDTNESE